VEVIRHDAVSQKTQGMATLGSDDDIDEGLVIAEPIEQSGSSD
jgi:hypothetical protein